MIKKMLLVFLAVIIVTTFSQVQYSQASTSKELYSEQIASGKGTTVYDDSQIRTLYLLDLIELDKEILAQNGSIVDAINKNTDLKKQEINLLKDIKVLLQENLENGIGAE